MSNENEPGAQARTTVFLSYGRADQHRATKLAHALEAADLVVWWDTQIEGGAAFAKSIETELERCDAVIVAWSKSSATSDWVLDEAAQGRDLRKLVPVTLDGSAPPLGFRQYQSIDLSSWRGNAAAPEIAALLRGIAAAAGHALRAKPSEPARPRPPTLLSRRVLVAGAAGVAVAGAAGLLAWRRGMFRGPVGNSVAVIPFANLSGDPGQDYFAAGLAEELRATLARNLDLQVMAQASSARFRDSQDDAVTIASTLGVAFLLDGSVQRSKEIVRVTADLIDGETGFSRWSQIFDRDLQDIFTVQSEIATTVAGALVAEVAPAAPVAGATANVEAFDAFLRGRALYDLSVDEASERAALAQFDRAIAADPHYAAAHAARARTLTAIANQYAQMGETAGLYEQAIAAARRAVEIAPDLADAHSTLGFILFQGQLDVRAAREPFERSRELGAGESTVLARYAQYSARTGREREAAEAIGRALVLDKLNPLIHRAAGQIAYAARDYGGSLAPLRKALAMNPRLSQAHAAIGNALLMQGRLDEARAEYEAEPVDDFRLAGLAIVEHRLGRVPEARAALAQLVADHGDRVLYQRAQVSAQWGDRDEAIARLQDARRLSDSGLIYARNDPMLDPLRDDARFKQLLAGLGFE
jgi:TolB-like protein/Flp pilus assembly protein TadD